MKKCNHQIVLNEENHEYRCSLCGKVFISVTQVLKKHNLSADFSGIDEDVLRAKAERGTLIHKQLENYINTGEIGFADEVEWFAKWVRENNVTNLRSEQIVNNETVAGTLDVRGVLKDGRTFKGDFKTSAKLDKQIVSWQVTTYDELDKQNADVLFAFHFTKKEMKAVELTPIPRAEVKRLLKCEADGTSYARNQIVLAEDLKLAVEKWERQVYELEQQTKQAALVRDEYRSALVELFERHGADCSCSIDTGAVRITYVAPSERTTIDTSSLRVAMPEVAERFSKTTPIKASVRVTLRDKGGA